MRRFECRETDDMLSLKAVEETISTGTTSIVCPRCNTKPTFDISVTPTTKRVERVVGGCECGYICYVAISISYIPLPDDNKNFSMGYRKLSKEPLSREEINTVVEAACSINIPVEALVFNNQKALSGPTGTSYNFFDDKVYIAQNVFPDDNSNSIHPRDLLSVRAVLAHEYYGHRAFRQEYLSDYENNKSTTTYWEDEARASINAAKYAPNLSQLERCMLIQDATYRAKEHAQVLELDDFMKNMLFGDGTAKPLSIPIRYRAERDVEAELKQKLKELYPEQYTEQTAPDKELDEELDI